MQLLFVLLLTAFSVLLPLAGGEQVPWMIGGGSLSLSFFTHLWIHQSLYHLLLDGSAFMSLWAFSRGGTLRRLLLCLSANAGSVAAVLMTGLQGSGAFGGLSGVAHGLMAVVAIEWMQEQDRSLSRAGIALLSILFLKCGIELWTGAPAFSALHLGDIGTPLVACHAGGVLGALTGLGVEALLSRGLAHHSLLRKVNV